jgi:hypothetical protein
VSDFLIALVELLEAEGRAAKRHVLRAGAGLGLLFAAIVLFLAGMGFLVAAAYVTLAGALSPSVALVICGAVVLVLGGATTWIARRVAR